MILSLFFSVETVAVWLPHILIWFISLLVLTHRQSTCSIISQLLFRPVDESTELSRTNANEIFSRLQKKIDIDKRSKRRICCVSFVLCYVDRKSHLSCIQTFPQTNAQHSRVFTTKSSSGASGSLAYVLHRCDRPKFKSPSNHKPNLPLEKITMLLLFMYLIIWSMWSSPIWKRKELRRRKRNTHSPAPMDKLSGLPLIKYKFSPVQWNTLKLGLNLNSKDSPVP